MNCKKNYGFFKLKQIGFASKIFKNGILYIRLDPYHRQHI